MADGGSHRRQILTNEITPAPAGEIAAGRTTMQFEESDTRGRSSDRVALTVPIALWAGPSQGYRATPLRPTRSGILGAN